LIAFSTLVPVFQAYMLDFSFAPTSQQIMLVQSFSLLLLGAALATLATINFSQAFFIGILASPLSFVRPLSIPRSLPIAIRAPLAVVVVAGMLAVSPLPLLFANSHYFNRSFHHMLVEAAWGWKIEKVWTSITVWIIWWPAWVCGTIVLLNGLMPPRQPAQVKSR